jgi:hypothetical protein
MLVAAAGAVLLSIGVLITGPLAPADATIAQLDAGTRAPVVTSAPGLLGLGGSRVQIDASATGSHRVFIGVGRSADVEAYLGGVARVEATGWDGDGALVVTRRGGQATLPDPNGVDVWVASASAPGTASLIWPDQPGRWRLVVATDGTAPAPALALSWPRTGNGSAVPALIAVGLMLLVGGLVSLAVQVVKARGPKGGPPEAGRPGASPDAPSRPAADTPSGGVNVPDDEATTVLRRMPGSEPVPTTRRAAREAAARRSR